MCPLEGGLCRGVLIACPYKGVRVEGGLIIRPYCVALLARPALGAALRIPYAEPFIPHRLLEGSRAFALADTLPPSCKRTLPHPYGMTPERLWPEFFDVEIKTLCYCL